MLKIETIKFSGVVETVVSSILLKNEQKKSLISALACILSIVHSIGSRLMYFTVV